MASLFLMDLKLSQLSWLIEYRLYLNTRNS